jgi:hypothetical protein
MVVLALVAVAAGCSSDDSTGGTIGTTTGQSTGTAGRGSKITLLVARTSSGPWVRSLSLEHSPQDGQPVSFFVCAAWDEAVAPEGCNAASGAELPGATILRLEQRPVGAASASLDSSGWGTVGTSEEPELAIPLSDFVSGLDVPRASYRATLRRFDGGPAHATSNVVTVTWAG